MVTEALLHVLGESPSVEGRVLLAIDGRLCANLDEVVRAHHVAALTTAADDGVINGDILKRLDVFDDLEATPTLERRCFVLGDERRFAIYETDDP